MAKVLWAAFDIPISLSRESNLPRIAGDVVSLVPRGGAPTEMYE